MTNDEQRREAGEVSTLTDAERFYDAYLGSVTVRCMVDMALSAELSVPFGFTDESFADHCWAQANRAARDHLRRRG